MFKNILGKFIDNWSIRGHEEEPKVLVVCLLGSCSLKESCHSLQSTLPNYCLMEHVSGLYWEDLHSYSVFKMSGIQKFLYRNVKA